MSRTVRSGSPVSRARGSHFKRSTSRSNWNLEVLVFVEGGKSEKNPQSKVRTNNKLNLHETASTGIEPCHRGGRRALIHCAIRVPQTDKKSSAQILPTPPVKYRQQCRYRGVGPGFFTGGVGGGGRRSHCVKQRVLTRFVMSTSTLCFTVTVFRWAVKVVGRQPYKIAAKNQDLVMTLSPPEYFSLFA